MLTMLGVPSGDPIPIMAGSFTRSDEHLEALATLALTYCCLRSDASKVNHTAEYWALVARKDWPLGSEPTLTVVN